MLIKNAAGAATRAIEGVGDVESIEVQKPKRRKNVAKPVATAETTADKPQVIGVVVNRVADARAIFEQLDIPAERKMLLTGRTRGLDRDRLLASWLPRLRASKDRSGLAESIVVVATQCIEVGANLDFDMLVTECAALDALRQRFGRLNRLGLRQEARAIIVSFEKPNEEDPVYGAAVAKTWAFLTATATATTGGSGRKKVEERVLDFGVDALDATLSNSTPEEGVGLFAPSSNAPLLRPSDLDLLVQTNPRPEPSPDISEFLHGLGVRTSDVTMVWRADLVVGDEPAWAEVVAVQPPSVGEGCPVPIWAAQKWLREADALDPLGDVEGSIQVANGSAEPNGGRLALRWRGSSDAKLIAANGLKPGDVLVVPAAWGGCDQYGWKPDSAISVTDVGDVAAAAYRARPVLRLAAPLAASWKIEGATIDERWSPDIELLRSPEASPKQRRAVIDRLSADPTVTAWTRAVVSAFSQRGFRFVQVGGTTALVGRPSRAGADPEVSTSDDNSSATVFAPLSEHSLGVEGWARRLASGAQLDASIVAAIAFAGWLHDVGKADPRFQVWLHDGDEVAAAAASAPLAKSKTNPRNKAAIERARIRARYPKGMRHEMLSVAMITASTEVRKLATSRQLDWNLIVHLVASHHGFARPFAPVSELDTEPLEVSLMHRDGERVAFQLSARSDHGLERADSGVADRFWLLVRRYGWHGLAYLEAILRLADHRRSEEEERLALATGIEDA